MGGFYHLGLPKNTTQYVDREGDERNENPNWKCQDYNKLYRVYYYILILQYSSNNTTFVTITIAYCLLGLLLLTRTILLASIQQLLKINYLLGPLQVNKSHRRRRTALSFCVKKVPNPGTVCKGSSPEDRQERGRGRA